MIAQPAKFRLKHGHRCGLGLEGLVHEATASPDVGRAAVYLAEARSEGLEHGKCKRIIPALEEYSLGAKGASDLRRLHESGASRNVSSKAWTLRERGRVQTFYPPWSRYGGLEGSDSVSR